LIKQRDGFLWRAAMLSLHNKISGKPENPEKISKRVCFHFKPGFNPGAVSAI
jgi:hypothetical protein